jgi:phage baseplate assembly protein W
VASWTLPLAVRPLPPPLSEAERLFGRDIRFEGDYVVNAKGDYATVSGFENLRASLWRRMATSPGEYALRPGYGAGLRDAVKKPFTTSARDEIRSRVTEQALADSRVTRVREVLVEQEADPRQIRVTLRVDALGRKNVPIPLEFREVNRGSS